MAEELSQGPFIRDDEDEGLFSRDIEGQLVRLDAPTEEDYRKRISLQIDGRAITVPLAEPLTDSQGNVVLDIDGRTTPRYTTIYDAALKAYGGEEERGTSSSKIPIPVLCHQPHLRPVAVCRLCVVQIYGMKRGKRTGERKLFPACQHQVKEGMEVFTMNDAGPDGERVRKAVGTMTELLMADHLKKALLPEPIAAELAPFNELQRTAERCNLESSRLAADEFKHASAPKPASTSIPHRPVDKSSPVFLVDHSACILCDRCSRSCDELKQNLVIGRTGKGATAGIAFDLDVPMGDSTCVQCGECMVSCPTSAITFNPVRRVKPPVQALSKPEFVSAQELIQDPLFADVPPKFLLWQEGLVLRRKVRAGEPLCKQGDPGNTAYLIRSGRLEVVVWPAVEGGGKQKPEPIRFSRGAEDLVVGEMACLSGTPRTADVTAVEAGEIWEMRRNVLDRLMRSPAQRTRFERIYRGHALDLALRNSELFRGLPSDEYQRCLEFLKKKLSFVRVEPNQVIFRQDDWSDNLYLVRLGHVRVSISQGGREITVLYRRAGDVIGEIGLLALLPEDARKGEDASVASLQELLKSEESIPVGKRTATCSALDHLELARIGRQDFLDLLRLSEPVLRRLVRLALGRLDETDRAPKDMFLGELRREYIAQGYYQGRSLLVLDLDRCTRCDECTNACVAQHGTESHGLEITRLLREGPQFGNFLVAHACRSCKDAYCMNGCPVDSIHRGKHLQIVIEDHCIGCGLCARNCPYDNIFMLPNAKRQIEMPDPENPAATRLVAQPKAATCDLCDAEGHVKVPKPRCVQACPHDAAFRMTGEELLEKVSNRAR